MARKRKLSAEEIELFRSEVGAVNPLRSANRADLGRKPKQPSGTTRRRRDPLQERIDQLDTFEPVEAEAGEELLFIRPGVQHALLRKMRKGRYVIRSELDLHGLTAAQARRELVSYLHDSRMRGERCVRIIHGKGYNSPDRRPVLKSKLNTWLRQCDEVLAFCSAPVADGGTGAVYVLLSRP
jgi:DNA-nicking Smr family endonuclease